MRFPTGENLLFGRNAYTAVIGSFGLWRYLNYEPADVVYIKDDRGEWVQIVSLIRWRGVFFPQPEFGGVYVVTQMEETLWRDLKLFILGAGVWVSPQDIGKYPCLRGQNILSYRVSRYIADSFRFKEGFTGPLPFYHYGDIRIPDLEADVNPQPFTVHINIPGREGGLYHYFGLEPVDVDKQGLSASIFIPADGSGPAYYYSHHERGEILIGVSAVSPKVRETKKHYDWDWHRPVEHRPVIKRIGSRVYFAWLTMVVTRKKQFEGDQHFMAGALPELALTDAAHGLTVWVDPRRPDTWIGEIQKNLQPIGQKHLQ